jgi:hypothetical protein
MAVDVARRQAGTRTLERRVGGGLVRTPRLSGSCPLKSAEALPARRYVAVRCGAEAVGPLRCFWHTCARSPCRHPHRSRRLRYTPIARDGRWRLPCPTHRPHRARPRRPGAWRFPNASTGRRRFWLSTTRSPTPTSWATSSGWILSRPSRTCSAAPPAIACGSIVAPDFNVMSATRRLLALDQVFRSSWPYGQVV